MSRQTTISDSLNFHPTGYTGQTNISAENSTYPWSRGYNDSSYTTNYARFQLSASSTSTDCYIYYTFSVNGIPSNATITSVSCSARISKNSRVGTSTIQLYNGTTAKGSSTTFSSTQTTGTNVSLTNISNTGSWTVSELNNLRLRITGRRSNTNNAGYIYFWGATVTINYSVQGTEYEVTSTLSTNKIDSIDPAGLNYIFEGNNYELSIYGESIDDIKVEDNGTNVTNSLVRHTVQLGETTISKTAESFTTGFSGGSSMSFYTSSSSATNNFNYAVGHTAENPGSTSSGSGSWTYVKDNGSSTNYTGYADFVFDFSEIPENAIINSVQVKCYGAIEDTSQTTSHADITLFSGSTQKGTRQSFTSSTNSIITISNVGTWTREELQNAKLRFAVGYYGGHIFGITWNVTYELPVQNPYYWTYTLTNVQADHTIIIGDAIIEIPEEDPQYEYYPITISSINATTDPGRGTTRVIEGTNQTITIYPSDPQITLVTDNGVDVSSQLVQHGGTIPDPTIATASGASYGFTLNSSTGYYVSNNKGVSKTAAVCRVTFNLPVRCLITIQFINYAEATYDFGVFGNIDVPLSTNYYPAGSSGATISETSYKLACNTSTYNKSTAQTLTYEIESGEHFIDIKYSKDDASDSNNDTLQWKISSIEALETNNYYTYTLSNVDEAHSLIFIFGNVTYYTITTSGSNCKLYPSGSMVVLPGESYTVTAVPDNYSFDVSGTDNNTNITASIQRVEQEITKEGNTYTVVNYTYSLSNIQSNHNIIINCIATQLTYIKLDNRWSTINNVYTKSSTAWSQQNSIVAALANVNNLIFFKGTLYDYVLTNCVMNFDGINSYANRYQDNTSGFEGEWVYPNGVSNNVMRLFDVTATGNSFVFNGTTSYIRPSASGPFDGFLYSSHTIEAYFELSSFNLTDGNAFMLYVGRNSTRTVALYCYYYLGSFYFIKSSGTSSKMLVLSSLSLNTKHYIAANANGWMFDGTYYPDSSSSAESNSAATNDVIMVSGQYACSSIGMRFKDGKDPEAFNGILYAMRIHSSQLTEAEMRNNMNTDIQRYP